MSPIFLSGACPRSSQGLAKAGLVTSQRGPCGGYLLVERPGDLTVHAVVQAIDPIARIIECPVGVVGHGATLRPLHRALDNTILAVETAFRKLGMRDLVDRHQAPRALCAFPCHAMPGRGRNDVAGRIIIGS
jgi:Rrf2 family nitric oxide-sensitive transcriptional repressor